MQLATLSRFGGREGRAPKAAGRRFRPQVEGLEERTVLSSAGSMTLPLSVTDIDVVGEGAARQLVAEVSFAGQATDQVAMGLRTTAVEGEECPVLNLELGPVNLNLLGLNVETSRICLDVTAVNDQGLLGGLLCDLSGGLDLGGIIDSLGDRLDGLLAQLDSLLDNILGRPMAVTGIFGSAPGGDEGVDQDGPFCDVLNLSLGPVDLEVPLLGVNVSLDDCEGGPVTVDVFADPDGGLLGSLLCNLAGGIDLDDINPGQLVGRIDRLIDGLTDLADRLDGIERLTRPIERLIDRLERASDRVEDLADLDRFLGRLERTVDLIGRLTR